MGIYHQIVIRFPWILSVLKHFRSAERKADDARVKEMMRKGISAAIEHYERQLEMLVADPDVRGASAESKLYRNVHDPELMLSIEMHFIWGWFYVYSERAGEWPTSPSQRATLLTLDYLMKRHGMSFNRARLEASDLDQFYNAADPLFEAITARGRESFDHPDDPLLALVVVRLGRD